MSLRAMGYADQVAALTPVQRSGGGPAAVHEIAARGIQGGSGRLPHHGAIQASFGKHDVSSVRAAVGGGAAEACGAMGAAAYATGATVAFTRAPDLHTAAHEAAHVVQQRSGVDLPGGVGRVGDRYERHADEVAGLVVQGKSAEQALDRFGQPGPQSNGVQRKTVLPDASDDPEMTRTKDDPLASEGGFQGPLPRAERAAAWLKALGPAISSFDDLLKKQSNHAGVFEAEAAGGPEPDLMEEILALVAQVILPGLLKGIASYVLPRLKEGAKPLAAAAYEAATETAKKTVEAGAKEATAGDRSDEVALAEYVRLFSNALHDGSRTAREAFRAGAGDAQYQDLTIAAMQEVTASNRAAEKPAKDLTLAKMHEGWMTYQAHQSAGSHEFTDATGSKQSATNMGAVAGAMETHPQDVARAIVPPHGAFDPHGPTPGVLVVHVDIVGEPWDLAVEVTQVEMEGLPEAAMKHFRKRALGAMGVPKVILARGERLYVDEHGSVQSHPPKGSWLYRTIADLGARKHSASAPECGGQSHPDRPYCSERPGTDAYLQGVERLQQLIGGFRPGSSFESS